MALQEPADSPEHPQFGSSDPDRDPDASKKTAVVGPSVLVPAGLQDPADPLPGPSALDPVAPKFPGASKHRRIGDQTRFRAACFTDPTPVPFDEIYEVGRKIGEGGFGTVYEGISKFLREQVAIKIVTKRDRDRFIVIPGCSKPLFAEVALNLLLKRPPLSPYIVHMLEWFEEEDRYILILEYPQPCKDLLKFMLNNMQLLDESQTRSLMYQAVLGAKHCLDRGVFHRDIKLNNFLINTTTNQIKLADFGCGDLVKTSGYLGFTGGVCPPEFYKDLKYEAGPTTVWSLGFMMYSMIYKRQPFRSLKDMMHGSLRFKHKISTELQDLICRCMTLDPTERATVEEILQHEWFQQGHIPGESMSTFPFDEIYEVGEEIGEGGFGTVYEGISKFLHEQVAIKFIPKCETDWYIEIPGCSKPLFAEVAVNLLLKRPPLSPYIVHMLEWFEEEDRYILILEYPQPCKDLLKFMVNNVQRVNESQTRSLMYQAVLGAKHCLDRGVFHRDIKLNNFVINTTTNQIKLIDFGCSDLVKTSGYLGDFTGGVCPPEYYRDLKYEAGPTTVWSLGIMMYTMVCRCQPFNSLEDTMHSSLSFNVRVSTEFQDLISRCLTYQPTERATVEEILQHEWFQQGHISEGAQDQGVTGSSDGQE
ncbi:uncharacterized protein LOC131531594 [Onychostoma macrolepis]|uniref:uncharacterized protein LOC131531594 n=1 Tax=Onychostoma macrolepis TaxID=369639 RepID=UPI00272B991D|nr:uncharacterized protein LOC131531594 [Onychostoma macrolepis]